MIGYIIVCVFGIILGAAFTKLVAKKPKVSGFLHIYDSVENYEDPYVFLDPDITVQEMAKETYVTFIISHKKHGIL